MSFFRDAGAVTILTIMILATFLLQLAIPGFTEMFVFNPSTFLQQPWTLITSMFLHGGISHIFFNLFALLMFGPIVERKIGKINFFYLYFLSGIVGGLLYWLTIIIGIIPPLPALGASGAIYGVMAAAAVFFPNMRVYIMGMLPLTMKSALVLWIIMEFLGVFNVGSGIASAAHLGGILVGYLYAKKLQKELYEPPIIQDSYYW